MPYPKPAVYFKAQLVTRNAWQFSQPWLRWIAVLLSLAYVEERAPWDAAPVHVKQVFGNSAHEGGLLHKVQSHLHVQYENPLLIADQSRRR